MIDALIKAAMLPVIIVFILALGLLELAGLLVARLRSTE